MDKQRLLLKSLPVLLQLSLLQIEASIGSDSRFNSEHLRYLPPVNKSETVGFLPSRAFHTPFGYGNNPTIPPFHFVNGFQSPSSIQQTRQLYQHPHPTFQSPEQHFQGRGFPYSPLPIGYFPPHFGGPSIPPFPLTSPYPTHTFGPPPSTYPQLSLPTPKIVLPVPPQQHYPHHHGLFPSPAAPPQYLDGFDVGSLPKQVRVPGKLEVNIKGKDANITCEFPTYLILVQGIYWHHKYPHDPFGSYFDSQDGFGAHTTVKTIDQWKSILVIQDFKVDDFGIYRCISTAALPAEVEFTPEAHPSTSAHPGFKTDYQNYRNNPNPVIPGVESPLSFPFESPESMNPSGSFHPIPNNSPSNEKKQRISRFTKNSRKMRFPPIEEAQRRSIRQLPFTASSQNNPDSKQVRSSSDLLTSSSTSQLRNYYNFLEPVSYSYANQDFGYRKLTNPYVEVDPFPQVPSNHIQNERHLPHFHFGYPGFGFGIPPPPATTYPFPQSYTAGFGLKVPYYKPEFSYCTVYQEVKFEPAGVVGRHGQR